MIKKGYKGDSLPIHLGLISKDHKVKSDNLVLLFSDQSRHRLYPFFNKEEMVLEGG